MPPSSRGQNVVCSASTAGRRAVHARDVGHEAGGVRKRDHFHHRLRTVDELDQHPRIHVAPRRLGNVGIRRRVGPKRIVLALPCRDDRIAQSTQEIDELHRRAGLVARAKRVDDARLLGLRRQVRTDGDVGLDVHHHDVLACRDRRERDVRTDVRIARRIDDHIDILGGADVVVRLAHGEAAAADDARHCGGVVRHFRRATSVAGDSTRGEHVFGIASAAATTSIPDMRSVCTMMSVPIWPAPIRPTRTGLPWRWRRSRPSATEPPVLSREVSGIDASWDALANGRNAFRVVEHL
jgi:hypothetical protein